MEEAMPDTLVASHAITVEDVEYQPGLLARLYRPAGTGPFPAALQVHGGAWQYGDKLNQAEPLLGYLAERGWICVTVNYRLAPSARWPAMIVALGSRTG